MAVRGKKAGKDPVSKIINRESKSKNPINSEDIIFALDIGTRSVVGIVGVEEDGIFNIIDVEVMEHKSRAMIDGQIHDISKVVEVVEIVKENLEIRLGFELKKVAIAAAGRALKTSSARVERKLEHGVTITQEMINSMEFEGIQIAYANLQEQNDTLDTSLYYCIGHTVVNYYLNGYDISNLIGHKGKVMGADVLATFLPHTVVDSLYAVMERVGLNVISLTLEPIAAINVSIPKEIRLLNLAMVDIGAGTSDIAITRDGAVVAYAMCPVAGDEITEKIAQHYLIDFNTAEKLKVSLQTKDSVEFQDIMGINRKVNSYEMIEALEPASYHLADVIAQKIIECNGKAPNAVFCVGGGSLTPRLRQLLAQKLDISDERVGVRGTDIIKNIKFKNKQLTGPEAITPVGIAMTVLEKRGHNFIEARVNKKKVRLFNTGKQVVGDALASSGITPEQLIPRMGKALTFELNKKKHVVKGGYGRPAELYVNTKTANLETPINNGDQIKVVPSLEGQPAKAFVEDFIHDFSVKKITFNNNELDITTKAILNSKPVSLKHAISEGDNLVIEEIKTIKDLAKICEVELDKFYMVVNCVRVDENYIIKSGDAITTVYITGKEETIKSEKSSTEYAIKTGLTIPNIYNAVQDVQPSIAADSIDNHDHYKDGHPGHKKIITVSVNNKLIKLKGKSKYIFIDVFDQFKPDTAKNKGSVMIKLNGIPASFTDLIRDGDTIDIYWE